MGEQCARRSARQGGWRRSRLPARYFSAGQPDAGAGVRLLYTCFAPMLHLTDTIAAIATPPGEGGVGIVRVSGPRALAIADALFRGGRKRPFVLPTHTLHYGAICD